MSSQGTNSSSSSGTALAKERVLLIGAIIGVLASAFTLWVKWDDWFEDQNSCVIAGSMVDRFSGQPILGASVGYAPDNGPFGTTPTFVKLAETGADGSFRGDCTGAYESGASDNSFEVLFTSSFVSGRLPCLETRHSNLRVKRTGTHENLSITAVC